MKIFASLALSLALCGCDAPDLVDTWEFQASVPIGTTVQEMMSIENTLKAEGYVRVRFITNYNWSNEPTGVTVFATKRGGGT